jgi:uncharacterized protein with NRDE domain
VCLIGLALDVHPRFALVIAANRDEFFDRPAAPLDWWRVGNDGPWVLAGRDLSAGGTWLGLADNGRVAALTNVRDPTRHRPDAASRGALVTAVLAGHAAIDGTNPYNLIAGDLVRHGWAWRSDSTPHTSALQPGIHGLSNAALATPWPKVRTLTRSMQRVLGDASDAGLLSERLFGLLADRSPAPDDELPDTGIGLERERWLSPAFIASPNGGYGTRCSTLVVGERRAGGWRLHVAERSFDARGIATLQRSVRLDGWPSPGDRPIVTETRLA